MSDTAIVRREKLIKVGSGNGTVGIAHVVVNALRSGNLVTLQAVGAGAVNIAVKGVASAGQMMARDGIGLVTEISFANGRPSKGHTDPVSVIVIKVSTKELS